MTVPPWLPPSRTRPCKCHHSTGQHSQGLYTLLFANHPRGPQSWNLLPWEGVQVAPSAFHWCVRPARVPCLSAVILMYTPAGTSDTTPGLLPALGKPASPSLGHQKGEATALSHGWGSATMRGCALGAPSLELTIPPCSLMPKQAVVKCSQIYSRGRQSLRNQSKSMPQSCHAA